MKQDLTLTLVQCELMWENPQANRERFNHLLQHLSTPTQVIVLPEMFSTGFSMRPFALAEPMDGPTVAWMQQMASQKGAALCGSLMIEEGGRYYNRLIWMEPSGMKHCYDKRHLFSMGSENQYYTAGRKRLTVTWHHWRLRLIICYDLRFPVWCRNDDEYDILVVVANWPQRRIEAWNALLVARAIENQCYVAGVNRVGNDGHQVYHNGSSCLIDPMGKVLWQCTDREEVYTATLSASWLQHVRQSLPFLGDRDRFEIIT
ncbi:MAG: amidohydrolase [Chitinophagales bacterium]|nr:amidohydrolase [Chitinophagales bacterium]MDW8427043.1 amidohydrolase [Chitinophagales bacterium]